ncbi:set domain-containing protein 5 [Phlyctema vagabunda]|uniref:Set domain-containing protein 5 n=1 Tax=Phlyctema vagabunda TaxID=108571 RepID=A0ABR4PR94_9HELO
MDDPPFAIVAIEGKGLGCVATRSIARGELIVSEPPLLTTDRSDVEFVEGITAAMYGTAVTEKVAKKIQELPKSKQVAFLSLHTKAPGKNPLVGICRANGLLINESTIGIYETISRFNHACAPMAEYRYNPEDGCGRIHAVWERGIAKGEEITIDYSLRRWDPLKRRDKLKRVSGFVCECRNICENKAALMASKTILREIEMYASPWDIPADMEVSDNNHWAHWPEECFLRARAEVMSYEKLGIYDTRSVDAYYRAWLICMSQRDMERGEMLAGIVADGYRTCLGNDHPRLVEFVRLAKNPTSLNFFGFGRWHNLKKYTCADRNRQLYWGKETKMAWLWCPGFLSLPENIFPVQVLYPAIWKCSARPGEPPADQYGKELEMEINKDFSNIGYKMVKCVDKSIEAGTAYLAEHAINVCINEGLRKTLLLLGKRDHNNKISPDNPDESGRWIEGASLMAELGSESSTSSRTGAVDDEDAKEYEPVLRDGDVEDGDFDAISIVTTHIGNSTSSSAEADTNESTEPVAFIPLGDLDDEGDFIQYAEYPLTMDLLSGCSVVKGQRVIIPPAEEDCYDDGEEEDDNEEDDHDKEDDNNEEDDDDNEENDESKSDKITSTVIRS